MFIVSALQLWDQKKSIWTHRNTQHAPTWKSALIKTQWYIYIFFPICLFKERTVVVPFCSLYSTFTSNMTSVQLCKTILLFVKYSVKLLFPQKQQQKHWMWCGTGQRWSPHADCMLGPVFMYSETILTAVGTYFMLADSKVMACKNIYVRSSWNDWCQLMLLKMNYFIYMCLNKSKR